MALVYIGILTNIYVQYGILTSNFHIGNLTINFKSLVLTKLMVRQDIFF